MVKWKIGPYGFFRDLPTSRPDTYEVCEKTNWQSCHEAQESPSACPDELDKRSRNIRSTWKRIDVVCASKETCNRCQSWKTSWWSQSTRRSVLRRILANEKWPRHCMWLLLIVISYWLSSGILGNFVEHVTEVEIICVGRNRLYYKYNLL